ncbi:MAG: hypothetical protein KA527_01565 [Cytophagaceae bacterium]|nr:hypothetical protein [Cytophagaceae bacterium]MBP6092745.1 hypothetical protein [Cytophagaceae bacterium]
MLNGYKSMQWVLSATLLIFSLFFSSCSDQVISGSGGYSDVSLNRNSSEYDIKRLKEVEVVGNSFWGVPYMKNKASANKSGFIFRFNGVSMFRTPAALPLLTLLSTTVWMGMTLEPVFGYKKVTERYGNQSFSYEDPDKPNLHWAIASVLALPIAGAINNQMYPNIAVSNAMHEMNYQLVHQNPDIDVFSNPKYVITNQRGFWRTEGNVKANVLGSRIRTERVVVPKP